MLHHLARHEHVRGPRALGGRRPALRDGVEVELRMALVVAVLAEPREPGGVDQRAGDQRPDQLGLEVRGHVEHAAATRWKQVLDDPQQLDVAREVVLGIPRKVPPTPLAQQGLDPRARRGGPRAALGQSPSSSL